MRTIVAAAVACLSIVSLSHADDARASIRNELSIPPQELVPALKALSREAQIHLVYLAEDVRGRRTAGVAGTLSIDEALQRILSGTGLTFRYIDEQTVSILPVAASGSSATATPIHKGPAAASTDPVNSSQREENGRGLAKFAAQEAGNVWSRFRLAQAEQAATESTRTAGDSSSSTASRPAIEEIVVTAQKREERLQDVPISISVLDGEELDKSSAQGITEMLSQVPGLAVSVAAQAGGTLLTLRGVTAPTGFNAGSSPVGYYLDSVPFGFVRSAIVPDLNVYDLDRIEVLRGPQGTLYGAGSQNGVVRVLTRDADLSELEFKARTGYSQTDDGEDNIRADAALNVPLISGKLAARAVVGYQELGGWIDKAAREDANGGELLNARLKLTAQPTDQLSLGLSAWISRSDFDAPSTAPNSASSPNADRERMRHDFDSYGLKVGYEFPAFSITSSTSYLEYLNEGDLDLTTLGISGVQTTRVAPKTFAQEVNLSSTHGGSWRWTAGAIYRDGEDELMTVRTGDVFPQLVTFASKSWASFGELTRVFLDGGLDLTVGLRHFEDEQQMRDISRRGNVPLTQPVNRDSEFDATTPRVVLAWHPQRSRTVYASYSEGFRSGFEQLPTVLAAAPNFAPVDPDLLKNFELGGKGNLWGGVVSYDAAVYYMKWEDVQLPLFIVVDGAPRSGAVNGPSASGIGADIGLSLNPIQGLALALTASWNDLTVDADVVSFPPGAPQGVVLFAEGDRLNQSNEYTVGAAIDYDFRVGGNGLRGSFSTSFNLTSKVSIATLVGTVPRVDVGDPIGIGRASFSIGSSERWTASLFVDNFNNEDGAVARSSTPVFDPRVRPRTIGLQLDYRFGK